MSALFDFDQLIADVRRRAEAFRLDEIAHLQRHRPKLARDSRLRAAALEQFAHALEQQERDAQEAR